MLHDTDIQEVAQMPKLSSVLSVFNGGHSLEQRHYILVVHRVLHKQTVTLFSFVAQAVIIC